MANLTDYIERHIKQMLRQTSRGVIEVQRRELAEKFNCVPSQINYVLSTRFTTDRGYIVESRRGGGGFIRIVKMRLSSNNRKVMFIDEAIGERLSDKEAEDILMRLADSDVINSRDLSFIRILIRKELAKVPFAVRDLVRARLVKAMIMMTLRERAE